MEKPDIHAPIGIIDSGMGGISIWAETVRMMPHETVVYWADHANCPYGGKSREEIQKLVSVGVEELIGRGVKIIVVACNTATTAAIDYLRNRWSDMSFIGLEPAVKPAARETRSGVIGVLGTRYTVNSELFRQTQEKYAGGIEVISVTGDGLVELVAGALVDSAEAELLLRRYIEPMLEKGADRLVLACTHYPLLSAAIERIIAGTGMKVINPAPAIARHTMKVMQEKGLVSDSNAAGGWDFISTAGEKEAERLRERAKTYIATVYGGNDLNG